MGESWDPVNGRYRNTDTDGPSLNPNPPAFEDTNYGRTLAAFAVVNELCKALTGEPAKFTKKDFYETKRQYT